MSSRPTGRQPAIPWMNVPGYGPLVYNSQTDQIILQNGRTLPRPRELLPRTLGPAIWNGQLPAFQYVAPSASGNYKTAGGQSMSPPSAGMNTLSLVPGRTMPTISQPPQVQVFFPTTHQNQALHQAPVMVSNEGVASTLFKAYKLRNSGFFKLGKVFLVLWSEPAGNTSVVSNMEAGTVINQLGERVFSKVRRFVVIREGGNYCSALPINTYGGRGVSKPGVSKFEHGIIYCGSPTPTVTKPEQPKANEQGMQRIPIRVDPDSQAERLDPMSRIDFGGITKVQHNIKAKSLGMVNQQSMQALRTQFEIVFQKLPAPVQPVDEDEEDDEDEDDDDEEEEDEEEDDDDDEEEEGEDDDSDDDTQATPTNQNTR